MNFPNLDGANDFPGVSNVRVYNQYKNGFDYTRWVADTQILLCSVPWDGSNNVVAFGSDETRNEWFADLDGYRDTLQTEMRILPDGMIKVPVPFDASGLYNYVWVTFPIATSAEKPLDYEPTSAVRHWGFFVDDMKYRSPSCTELTLTVDWWTTFINGIDVRSMMLARGHYAMTQAASVSDYLDEPLAHTAWLQGVEPETVGEPITNVKASIIVNDSDPYLVFDVGAASAGGDFTDGVPYASAHYATGKGFPTGQMFAVPLGSADAFATAAPAGLWQCVRAAYVVPSKFLNVGSSFTIGGVTVYSVTGGASVTQDVKLTASDFGYASDYAGITKLYTSPYATVHLVSDTGQDITIAPETLGSTQRVDMASQVTAAGVRVLSVMQGVGASTISNLTLRNLTARNFAQSGAWQKTIMQWDLPCFAVYQSSDELSDYLKQWSRTQARNNAYAAYQNALASNATAQTNANASATTARDNANASASTSQTNANASASAAQNNANASADTALTNTQATNATMVTNAGNTANNITSNNATTVAANSDISSRAQSAATSGAGYANAKLRTDVQYDIGNSNAAFDAEMAQLGVAATNNTVSSITGGLSELASGNFGGLANAVVGWYTGNASITVSQSNNTSVYNQAVTSAYGKQDSAITYTNSSTALKNANMIGNTTTQNNAMTTIATNNANLTNTNAANNRTTGNANASRSSNTSKANASRTYNATTANASRTYNTTTANAARDYNTSTANAARTYNTTVGNAQRTRDTSDANAQRTYDNALEGVQNGIYTDNAQAPRQFGAVAGMDARQIAPMGVQVKIERGTDDDIARCGDSMLRYGYCCNRNVSKFPGWQVMKHFTYWQSRETWMVANGNAPESAMQFIRALVESGVTVWGRPEEIGAVSIYDN